MIDPTDTLARRCSGKQRDVVVTAETFRLSHLDRVFDAKRQRARHQRVRDIDRDVESNRQYQPRSEHIRIVPALDESARNAARGRQPMRHRAVRRAPPRPQKELQGHTGAPGRTTKKKIAMSHR